MVGSGKNLEQRLIIQRDSRLFLTALVVSTPLSSAEVSGIIKL